MLRVIFILFFVVFLNNANANSILQKILTSRFTKTMNLVSWSLNKKIHEKLQ